LRNERTLPEGFDAVESFISIWVLSDTRARIQRRQASTLDELRAFYTAIQPLAEKAVEYLQDHPMGALPPEGERLLKLMLALAEIAPAVEWYDSVQVYDGFDMNRVTMPRQIPDLEAQH
jgi:hypothetical protein